MMTDDHLYSHNASKGSQEILQNHQSFHLLDISAPNSTWKLIDTSRLNKAQNSNEDQSLSDLHAEYEQVLGKCRSYIPLEDEHATFIDYILTYFFGNPCFNKVSFVTAN